MSTMTVAARSTVEATHTNDGMYVRVEGQLDAQSLPQLREVLLRRRPAHETDIIVDAGAVTSVGDEALAVLVAASAWAADTGARLSYSRMSDALRAEVDALGIGVALPMLAPIGTRAGSASPAPVLAPRTATVR